MIVDGTLAVNRQFPFYAVFLTKKNNSILCGGSIISERAILTSVSCSTKPKKVLAVVGSNDLLTGK